MSGMFGKMFGLSEARARVDELLRDPSVSEDLKKHARAMIAAFVFGQLLQQPRPPRRVYLPADLLSRLGRFFSPR